MVKRTCLTAVAWGLCLLGASVAATPPNGHVQASLVAEVTSVQPGQPFWVAVRLQMDEDWHTYWRNPGDAGLGTRITWQLPPGFEAGEIQWPFPHRFESGGIVSFGYKDEVWLLTELRPPKSLKAGAHLTLAARVNWLECADVCLPGKADVKLELPVRSGPPKPDARWADAFQKARARWPLTDARWQVSADRTPSRLTLRLRPPAHFTRDPGALYFFPIDGDLIDHAAEQTLVRTNTALELHLKPSPYAQTPPKRLRGVLVASEGWDPEGSRRALWVDVPLP